jgi:predicted membrane protein
MKKEEILKTIVALSFACLAVHFIFKLQWPVLLALLLLLSGIIGGNFPRLIATVWNKFALVVGLVNSKIILTAIFYLLVLPFALLSRIFDKKTTAYFKDRRKDSYFVETNAAASRDDFEKPW